MISINLKLEPLTTDAFSPFGDVIDIEQSGTTETINYGLTKRHAHFSLIDTHDDNGKRVELRNVTTSGGGIASGLFVNGVLQVRV